MAGVAGVPRDRGYSLPAGATEEVPLKGHVMPSHYDPPAAAEDSFDAAGFFKTGDLGLLDTEGYFVFEGRLKEMLKTAA